MYHIPEAKLTQCPAGCITGESRFLLEFDARARQLKEAGGVMFGTDAREWPCWWADMVSVIQIQMALEQNARYEAESRQR